ncbi:hypothetical protein [Clostridium sp.]|nr:hypothetical protein [Clostridium sp.]
MICNKKVKNNKMHNCINVVSRDKGGRVAGKNKKLILVDETKNTF